MEWFGRIAPDGDPRYSHDAEPEENTKGRRIPVPRGKLLGGSSSINGMVFVRGQAQDYDTWAQFGNRGWSYTDVLPIFKEMERDNAPRTDQIKQLVEVADLINSNVVVLNCFRVALSPCGDAGACCLVTMDPSIIIIMHIVH